MSELEELFADGWALYGDAGLPFVREYLFAVDRERNFRFDFAWPGLMVAVEIDGDCHRTKERFHRDAEKFNLATSLGWAVFRFGRRHMTKGLPPHAARSGFGQQMHAADLDKQRREAVEMVLATLRAKRRKRVKGVTP